MATDGKSKTLSHSLFAATLVGLVLVGYYAGEIIRMWHSDPIALQTGARYAVALRGDEPRLGAHEALVSIVQFSEFQCPFCARSVDPLLQAIQDYPNQVRLIYKHFPLNSHQRAMPAALSAWAAHRQGQFWPLHDWLFDNEARLDGLPQILAQHRIDPQQFAKDRESVLARERVEQDLAAGLRLGVNSTPTFVVNGHIYTGALSVQAWRSIIEHEREPAQALKAAGIATKEIYAALMQDAGTERKAPHIGPDPDRVYSISPGPDRPQLGPNDAAVTIIEFADFHCPYCARSSSVVRAVQQAYPQQVKLIFRQFPLTSHPKAGAAAIAALAAHRQGRFWDMHDRIFATQAKDRAQFRAIAQEIGLDLEQFDSDSDDVALVHVIEQDQALGRSLEVAGTPTFFLNGRFIGGMVPAEQFKRLVIDEIAQAKQSQANIIARESTHAR